MYRLLEVLFLRGEGGLVGAGLSLLVGEFGVCSGKGCPGSLTRSELGVRVWRCRKLGLAPGMRAYFMVH